jgi:phosphohistidine phosphatase
MELYLVRHGVAVDADSSLADEARPLSARGREEFGEEVRGLERIGARFDQLLHSPLLRAMETAELLMPLLSGESAVSSA